MNETIKETKVIEPVVSFNKLSELNKDLLVKGIKTREFVKIPAIMTLTKSKKTDRIQTAITLKLYDPQFSRLNLMPGNKYLEPTLFHKILTATKAEYNDPKGQPLTKWNKECIVRFVKGSYSNRDDEYYSLEVMFKLGIYLTHFFNYDEVEILKLLAEQKKFTPNWITRPDKIDFIESDAFSFE